MKTKFTPRGIELNKNGAIIVSSISNTKHINTLKEEFIGFRTPKRAASTALSQKQSIDANINNAFNRSRIENGRIQSKLHLQAKAKRK